MHRNTIFSLLALLFLALLLPSSAFCELKNLDDEGLSAVYAEGFTDFQINDLGIDSDGDGSSDMSRTYAYFNIRAETYTEIDSLKLGWHKEYDYKDPDPLVETWDEDWVNVRIGDKSDALTVTDDGYYNPTLDFLLEGFYFTADFYNIDDPDTRQLKSITFGAEHVRGDIEAVFNSFSGTIDNGDGTPEYNGHTLNLGPATITALPASANGATSDGFEISLNIENYDKGYWVTFDNAIVTPGP